MQKLGKLKERLKRLEKVAIAFSGGVDSSFLLKVAIDELGREQVLALTAKTSLVPQREQQEAIKLANQMQAKHLMVPINPLKSPQIASNPPRRCYYCKQEVMTALQEVAKKSGFEQLLDGTNFDDLKDYRPGQEAIQELGVLSPLQEALLTKAEIRELSKKIGLSTWQKPAMACLASRFPYGDPLTEGKLKQVEEGEELLFSLGFSQFRLRHHGETARLEVPEGDLVTLLEKRQIIVNVLKKLGFKYITMDLEGYRTGSLNEMLIKEE